MAKRIIFPPAQELVFDYLCQYVDKHERLPSAQQTAQSVGVHTKTVYQVARRLQLRGWLERGCSTPLDQAIICDNWGNF